jgi:hypothetical protein
MKPPSGLDPAARAAWKRCVAVFGADLGGFRDAVERYVRAVDLEARVRREWEALGRPLLVKHGAVGIHPLVKLLASTAAADHGARLGLDPMSSKRLYGPGHGGRPVGANSAPDRIAPWVPRPLLRDSEPPRVSLVGDDVPLLKVKRKRVPVLTPGKLAKRPEGA